MDNMFRGCSSLISLPNITKWNINNVKDMKMIFFGCSSLISLPDISRWKIVEFKSTETTLFNCLLPISLPEIKYCNFIENYESNLFQSSFNEAYEEINGYQKNENCESDFHI